MEALDIGLPQLIYIGMTLLSLGVIIANDGRPRGGNYSAVGSLIGTCIVYPLLWWGGFFH